jgi:hypothetical protein
MSRYFTDERIPTLTMALHDHMRVDGLKKLAGLVPLTGVTIPTRKAELVDYIVRRLEGDRLRKVWEGLDELQKAAVAEVVHSFGTRFDSDRFYAKYGDDPSWGSLSPYQRDKKPTALHFFFYGLGVMPDDLKERLKVFVPEPAEAEVETLDELPAAYDRPYRRWNGEQLPGGAQRMEPLYQ